MGSGFGKAGKRPHFCTPKPKRGGLSLQVLLLFHGVASRWPAEKKDWRGSWKKQKSPLTFAARFNRKRAPHGEKAERRKTFFVWVLGKSELLVTFAPRLNEAAAPGTRARKKETIFLADSETLLTFAPRFDRKRRTQYDNTPGFNPGTVSPTG